MSQRLYVTLVPCNQKLHVLSSKPSEDRLRENFHIIKATTPMRPTPPATDRPIMVDVLTPPDPELVPWAALADDDKDGAEEPEALTVTMTVSCCPREFVVS